jgi:hypothetical protein
MADRISPEQDYMTVSEGHERRQKKDAENQKRFEACQVPRRVPAERPWTLESCQQAMSVWVFPNGPDQTAETIHTVEGLLYDMNTGAWECESIAGFGWMR